MPKLTTAQTEYLQSHREETVAVLARNTGLTQTQVKDWLAAQEPVVRKKKPTLLNHTTAAGKRGKGPADGNVTIMTEAASEAVDSNRKRNMTRTKDAIHQIYDDED